MERVHGQYQAGDQGEEGRHYPAGDVSRWQRFLVIQCQGIKSGKQLKHYVTKQVVERNVKSVKRSKLASGPALLQLVAPACLSTSTLPQCALVCPNVPPLCLSVPQCAPMCLHSASVFHSVPQCASVCLSVSQCAPMCPSVPHPDKSLIILNHIISSDKGSWIAMLGRKAIEHSLEQWRHQSPQCIPSQPHHN